MSERSLVFTIVHPEGHPGGVSAITHDSKFIYAASHTQVVIWSKDTLEEEAVISGLDGQVMAIAQNSQYLYCWSGSNETRTEYAMFGDRVVIREKEVIQIWRKGEFNDPIQVFTPWGMLGMFRVDATHAYVWYQGRKHARPESFDLEFKKPLARLNYTPWKESLATDDQYVYICAFSHVQGRSYPKPDLDPERRGVVPAGIIRTMEALQSYRGLRSAELKRWRGEFFDRFGNIIGWCTNTAWLQQVVAGTIIPSELEKRRLIKLKNQWEAAIRKYKKGGGIGLQEGPSMLLIPPGMVREKKISAVTDRINHLIAETERMLPRLGNY